MVAEVAAAAEIMFQQQSVAVQYGLCVSTDVEIDSAASAAAALLLSKSPPSSAASTATKNTSSAIFRSPDSSVPLDISRSESALDCSTSIQTATTVVDSPRIAKFVPTISSGSHTATGPRSCNEDEHLCVDDLSKQLGAIYRWPVPSSFYAVFDGHGGVEAASYVKNNALRFFFQDALLPQEPQIDDSVLEELEIFHRRAFSVADQALAGECSVDTYCGTTAITALVLGRHLVVANAGDCRAVLCRKGAAVQLSQDHRPSCVVERKRVEDLGGSIEFGYLNGELAVTRALGDWYMKLPYDSGSPLISEPEVQQILLTKDDEFLIIGCDGIWDVMSNQDAIDIVRRELRQHGDPQLCARELVDQALHRDTCDNLTAIVVCFTAPSERDPPSQRPRLRCCSLSEEARRKLCSLLEGN